MKFIQLLLVLLLSANFILPQVENKNQLLNNTVYNIAPERIKKRKAFIREWQFFEQRAYPYDTIPADAYSNALKQRDELRQDNKNKGKVENATWVSLGPTSGYYFSYGNISSRIVTGVFNPLNPDIIYIGAANGGVWKSTDGGTVWRPLTDDQASMSMGAITLDPVNPDIIYAGTGEATYSGASYYGRGLLKSTDGGETWTHITSGLPSSSYFSRILVRPGHSEQLLAALGSSGLFRSTDAGMTWTTLLSGRCDDIVFSPTGDTAFAIGGGINLRRSLDGGATFSSFGTGLPGGERIHFDLCKSTPAVMYTAIYSSSDFVAYKSTNYGANWTQAAPSYDFEGGQAWYDMYCRVNPQNPNMIYIGAIDVHRSTDGGNSFTNITYGYSGGSVHVDNHFLFFHPTDANTFIVCNDGGIYKSINNGASFTNLNQNLTLTQFYRIASSPFDAGRILGGTQDNGTQQTYSTLNWEAAFGGDGGEVCFNPFSNLYILGETQNGGLVRTQNGGSSWMDATNGLNSGESVDWVAPIVAHPQTSGIFYTARQKVYKTTNNGGLWTAVSANVNGTSAVSELAISKSNPEIMFAASGSKVFASSDGGATWRNVTAGLPSRSITSVYVHPDNPQIVLLSFSGFGTGKIYKSTDGGTSWANMTGNLPDSPANDLFIYANEANTYFAATDVGVFLTRDNGTNWIEIYDGLPNTVAMHLDFQPLTNTLRIGTHGRGVYEAYINSIVPVELASFTASVSKERQVTLNWTTATETNNRGFEIERKLKNQEWQTIGFVAGKGTVTEKSSYTYADNFSQNYEGKILYRLKQFDFNGKYEYSNYINTDVDFVPKEIVLYQNYPNPFNPSTSIRFSLPKQAHIKLNIYNQLGEKVKDLLDEELEAGSHELTIDMKGLSSGVYYYRFETGNYMESKKMILMK